MGRDGFRGLVGVAVLFAGLSSHAYSAQIDLLAPGANGTPTIRVLGRLAIGDEQAFIKVALPIEKAVVVLESEGGSLLAGIEIGRAIRLKRFNTFVSSGSVCASACALAWLGGMQRYLQPGSRIGFHAAYARDGTIVRETAQGNAVAGAYLNQLGLPISAVLYITAAAPDEMNWLTADVARGVGIEVSEIRLPDSVASQPRTVTIEEPAKEGGYLFDVLKDRSYLTSWSKMIRGYRNSKAKPNLPIWLSNYEKNGFDGVAAPGEITKIEGRSVEIYWVAESHNAGNEFYVLFEPGGGSAKGVWMDHDATPQFLGKPSPAEKEALLAKAERDRAEGEALIRSLSPN